MKRTIPLALVVDDDLSLRLSIRATLVKAGFEVIQADGGRRAMTLFSEHHPDLILLDVMMPEMDGFATCAAIRALPGGNSSQILMVTGLDDVESTQRAFEAGANDFITKPINWVMLGYRARYMLRAGRAFQELERNLQRLTRTQRIARIGNWEMDLEQRVFSCSPAARELLGLPMAEEPIDYQKFLQPIIAGEREEVQQQLDTAMTRRTSCNLTYRITLADGGLRHILNYGEPVIDELGTAIMLGTIQDISSLKQAQEQARFLGFYDPLTGLANRALFLDRLSLAVIDAGRQRQCLAVLTLDLDCFKRINESFGYHIGDQLLKAFSTAAQGCIRKSDTIARLPDTDTAPLISRMAGDQFALLLPNIGKPDNAAMVAQRLIDGIPASYRIEGNEIFLTTSIGISIFPQDGEEPERLLQHADTARRHAKQQGRNSYQFFNDSMNVASRDRLRLENDLHKALDREELLLYYQPKINLADRRIIGAEALIRWQHPERGMVPPDHFIPAAEESGMILEINQWVVETACAANGTLQEMGLEPIPIAVNISGHQFGRQDINGIFAKALRDTGLDARCLEMEITENILMQTGEGVIDVLKALQATGITIALDDFGTGYSSLSYLTSFPVNSIKIDRSFIMHSNERPKDRIITRAIIAMGHSLGMKVVAEGIETDDHLQRLRQDGCDLGQGYLFSPPVPLDRFSKQVRAGTL